MTEIEQLEQEIIDLASQITRAKEEFAMALKEREETLSAMREELEILKQKAKEEEAARKAAEEETAKRKEEEEKQEHLKQEIEQIEEEKRRLEERESALRAALEHKASLDQKSENEHSRDHAVQAEHTKEEAKVLTPTPPEHKSDHDVKKHESTPNPTPASAYVPGPLRETKNEPLSTEEKSSLRDAIFATKSAPIAASHMGGTPLGSAQSTPQKTQPLQQPQGSGAHTFTQKEWKPARMSSFDDQPVDLGYSHKDTLL